MRPFFTVKLFRNEANDKSCTFSRRTGGMALPGTIPGEILEVHQHPGWRSLDRGSREIRSKLLRSRRQIVATGAVLLR
jgi:hypothetical protein